MIMEMGFMQQPSLECAAVSRKERRRCMQADEASCAGDGAIYITGMPGFDVCFFKKKTEKALV
jgi:hypothetical protein